MSRPAQHDSRKERGELLESLRTAKFFAKFFILVLTTPAGILNSASPQKFFRLKNSGRILEDRYAFD
jgi:hypothetical protein